VQINLEEQTQRCTVLHRSTGVNQDTSQTGG